MAEADIADEGPLPAGGFSEWLDGMLRALAGEQPSDVPCGTCTGCCRSSQFIHIGPEEVETLARIPQDLLFPAPRMPAGNVLLGYNKQGHCPMLVDDQCSIYEHRPSTCRTYDCRVFPAAGVAVDDDDDDDKAPIARHARRWRFDHTDDDRVRHAAVQAAAAFVRERSDALPEGAAPANTTQRAVLAVRLHDMFLSHDDNTGRISVVDPDPDTVRKALTSRTRYREP